MITRFYSDWEDLFTKEFSWKEFTFINLSANATTYDVTFNVGLLGFCFSLEIER